MNTFVILSCLVAIAACQEAVPIPVAILRQETTGEGANFNHVFESEDGVVVESSGSVGSAGQVNLAGGYSFTDENGNLLEVRYVADEAGFQATGNHLPQVVEAIHPAPAHVAELLRIAEEQRAQGIQFDNQGFRI
ncbi:unnamed protein product [Meganyctiphanes norvegica]|uniref:Uncharacterized protein n=1 Tax=Meganyctiphanes norvegica TaxID=48144 RepID=A0AAV2SUB7_MEGNR